MPDTSYRKMRTVGITSYILRVSFFLLLCLVFQSGCKKSLTNSGPQLPSQAVLTHLPCDSGAVIWMQPYGNVNHGGGNAFFHNGIDFGYQANGPFFSCADGYVTEVDLNTGVGAAGTNYRIIIKVAKNVSLDYHFELCGNVPELQRRNNIFVTAGDTVVAGQPIGNLIVMDPNLTHVHWMIIENGEADNCPLDYFSDAAAQSFEALYDSGIIKCPASRPDLCE